MNVLFLIYILFLGRSGYQIELFLGAEKAVVRRMYKKVTAKKNKKTKYKKAAGCSQPVVILWIAVVASFVLPLILVLMVSGAVNSAARCGLGFISPVAPELFIS